MSDGRGVACRCPRRLRPGLPTTKRRRPCRSTACWTGPTPWADTARSAAGSCPRRLMDALNQLAAAYEEARADPAFQERLARLPEALRRPPLAAVPRRAADEDGRRRGDLPEARGPEPHRRPQDQQRDRPGDAGAADGQDAGDRRDRGGPARRGDGDGLRPLRHRVHGLHGRGGHPPPEAQRLQHEDAGRRTWCR